MFALSIAALFALAPAHAQSFSGSGSTVDSASTQTPDYYTVQAGDTLWDISRTFLGDPQYWPRLWSINDYITNPHWIYPGNRIAFRLGTDTEPPVVELEVTASEPTAPASLSFEYPDAQCGPDVRFRDPIESRSYNAVGFLADADDVDVYGHLYRAKTGHYWLGEGNLVYLKMDDAQAYDCGDMLTIFRQTKKKVRDPRKHSTKYGSAYQIVGEARVVNRVGDILSAVVRTSYTELERGDLVGPLMASRVELEVQEPDGSLAGHVIGRANDENTLIGSDETVFLNVGRADGTRVGDSFYAVQQRDEAISLNDDDTDLPETVMGRIVVVRVDEYTATGVVTNAARSIDDGTRIVQKVDDR